MKLGNISPNQCSFFISGTKLGAGTFMSHNINEDLSYINDKIMVDIRGENIGIRPPFNQVFFGITHTANYTLLNCFRTIQDFVERPGFYAISIVLPPNKSMMPGKAVELLRKLNDLYYDMYVKPNTAFNCQILKDVEENKNIFVDIASSPNYNIINADSSISYNQKSQIAYKYNNEQELNQLFDFCHRDELLNAENAFIFSMDQVSMCPSNIAIQTSLPQEIKTYSFKILPLYNGVPVQNAKIIFNKNGQTITPQEDPSILAKIKQSDVIEITIMASEFETKTISKHELMSHSSFEQNGLISVPVNLSKRAILSTPPFTPTTPKQQVPKEPKIPKLVLVAIAVAAVAICVMVILNIPGLLDVNDDGSLQNQAKNNPVNTPVEKDTIKQKREDSLANVNNQRLKDSLEAESDKAAADNEVTEKAEENTVESSKKKKTTNAEENTTESTKKKKKKTTNAEENNTEPTKKKKKKTTNAKENTTVPSKKKKENANEDKK